MDAADNDPYLDWTYCNGNSVPTVAVPSGSHTFLMPADPGMFDFRLFANNSLTLLAKSEPVEVSENPEPPFPSGDWVQVAGWVQLPVFIKRSDIPPE